MKFIFISIIMFFFITPAFAMKRDQTKIGEEGSAGIQASESQPVEGANNPKFKIDQIIDAGISEKNSLVRLHCNEVENMDDFTYFHFGIEYLDAKDWNNVGGISIVLYPYGRSEDYKSSHLLIDTIKVHEDYRKRGIAKAALKIIMTNYKNELFQLFLAKILDPENIESMKLFSSLQFKEDELCDLDQSEKIFILPKWKFFEQDKICRSCGKMDKNLLRCGQCKVAYYCDTNCQTKDWKSHKNSCRGLH